MRCLSLASRLRGNRIHRTRTWIVHRVGVGAHLRNIESAQLCLWRDTNAEDHVADLEEDPAHAPDIDEAGKHTDDLSDELAWVTVEEPSGAARNTVPEAAIIARPIGE